MTREVLGHQIDSHDMPYILTVLLVLEALDSSVVMVNDVYIYLVPSNNRLLAMYSLS